MANVKLVGGLSADVIIENDNKQFVNAKQKAKLNNFSPIKVTSKDNKNFVPSDSLQGRMPSIEYGDVITIIPDKTYVVTEPYLTFGGGAPNQPIYRPRNNTSGNYVYFDKYTFTSVNPIKLMYREGCWIATDLVYIDASDVKYSDTTSNLTSTNVQGVINEILSKNNNNNNSNILKPFEAVSNDSGQTYMINENVDISFGCKIMINVNVNNLQGAMLCFKNGNKYQIIHKDKSGYRQLINSDVFIANSVEPYTLQFVNDPIKGSVWYTIENSANYIGYDGRESNLTSVNVQNAIDELSEKVNNSLPTGTILPFGGKTAPNGFMLCNGQAISRTTYKYLFKVIGTSYGNGDGTTTFNIPNLQGRFPLGSNDTYTIGQNGGEENHTLTVEEMPSHTHTQNPHSHNASSSYGGAHTHSLSINANGSHTHSLSGTADGAGAHNHSLQWGDNGPTGNGYNIMYGWKGTNSNNDYTSTGVAEVGAHTHSISGTANSSGSHSHTGNAQSAGAHNHTIGIDSTSATNNNTGGGQAHNNMPPYLAMNFIIKY